MPAPLEPRPPVLGAFDSERIRAQFPALAERVNGAPLVYLFAAASRWGRRRKQVVVR